MLKKIVIAIGFASCILAACSSAGPSASNCYGSGQIGCETYWKNGAPKSVVVEPNIDDDFFIKKYKVPNKQMYINRNEVSPAKWWKKTGVSALETRKAVLECGSSIYWGKSEFELMKLLSLAQYNNGLVLVKKCMLSDGFAYLGNFNPCFLGSNLPACQDDATILKRNVSYRLDSTYCMETPILHECEPQSYERRFNSTHCRNYPQQNICQEREPELFCNKFPKADQCQPYKDSDASKAEVVNSSSNESITHSKKDTSNTATTSDDKLLELFFPVFFHRHPMSPESKNHLARELENQNLQQNTQKENNHQMKNLLKNTTPKVGR